MKTASEPEWRDWPSPVYIEASALAKLYLPEPGSRDMESRVEDRRDLIVSDLTVTEISSALARCCREGKVTSRAATLIHERLRTHLEEGVFLRAQITGAIHRRAEQILLAPDGPPLRSLDALHIALAQATGAQAIVTYDTRLTAAARRWGFVVVP